LFVRFEEKIQQAKMGPNESNLCAGQALRDPDGPDMLWCVHGRAQDRIDFHITQLGSEKRKKKVFILFSQVCVCLSRVLMVAAA
jgi:hypothetical protein